MVLCTLGLAIGLNKLPSALQIACRVAGGGAADRQRLGVQHLVDFYHEAGALMFHGASHKRGTTRRVIHMCIRTYIHLYIHTHIHIYIYIYTCTHIYVYIYIHIHICVHTYIYIYVYICIYVHMITYISESTTTHVYPHAHTCVYMCTRI